MPCPAYNGHGPWLDGYRRMLEIYRPFKQDLLGIAWRPFTPAEIREILDAFAHPDSQRGIEIRKRKDLIEE